MTMYRPASRLFLPLCLFLSLPALAQDGTQSPPSSPEPLPGIEAFVDGAVEAAMAEHKALPGITVSVVKDGKIVLLKGYGFADVEKKTPVDPEKSMFRIGSITKTFTALAVMQLVEQGKINLDADVNTYLKSFRIPETFPEPVTMRSLLSHRTGFEDAAAGHLFEQEPEQVMPMAEYLRTHMPKRVHPVGQASTYSNYGVVLAGFIVEVVSGMDYPSYIEKHIFEPLGMTWSTVREPLGAGNPLNVSPERKPWLVTGYKKGPDGEPLATPFDLISQVAPAGAISSSARDMALYMMARLEYDRYPSGRLIRPETTAAMRLRLYHDRPETMDFAYLMADAERDGYKLLWHNGGTTTFFSDMSLYPELKLGIFISTNSSDGGPRASGSIPALIFERFYPSKLTFEAPEPPEDFKVRGQKYAGTYMMSRRSYTQLEKLSALGGVAQFAVDEDGYLVMSGMGQNVKWVEVEPGVFQTAEEHPKDRGRSQTIYFYDDASGRPTRVSLTANDLIRISFWESPRFFFIAFGAATLLSLTTVLGAWRRARRGLDQSAGGKWASRFSSLAALAVLFAVGGGAVASGNIDTLMFNFPGPALMTTLYAILALIVLSIGVLVTLPAAWKDAGWSTWRRLHQTVFAIALIVMLAVCHEWNLIGFNYF